ARDRRHRNIARIFAVLTRDPHADHLPGRAFEPLLDVDVSRQLLSVDIENAVARFYVQSWLCQRRLLTRIEFAARIYLRDAIVISLDLVIRSQQPARHLLRIRYLSAVPAQMPDGERAQHLLKDIVQIRT